MYYVYVLRSLSRGVLYIGCTNSLKTRVIRHQHRQVVATKGKGPWELLYYEVYRLRDEAYERERRLKQFGGAYRQLRKRLLVPFQLSLPKIFRSLQQIRYGFSPLNG